MLKNCNIEKQDTLSDLDTPEDDGSGKTETKKKKGQN